jgi:hypothetical protein
MYEWIEEIRLQPETNNEFIDGYSEYVRSKDEIFIGMNFQVEEYEPIIYNREEAARTLSYLMSLDVGPMESVTIVGNSRMWHAGPKEIVDWLREGF